MDSPGRPNGNVTIPRLEVQTIHTSSQRADPEIAGLICIKTVDTVVRQLFQTVGLRTVMFKTVPVKTIQSTDISTDPEITAGIHFPDKQQCYC